MVIQSESPVVTQKQAAEYLGVHTNTVIRWIKAGKIQMSQPMGRKGRVLVSLESIERLAHLRNGN